ncbi:MAG: hypothetical protein HRU27_20660 [Rhizobiaceae bacterium]|nr:hypothetical protein [Rhizobiaceae bacterium]
MDGIDHRIEGHSVHRRGRQLLADNETGLRQEDLAAQPKPATRNYMHKFIEDLSLVFWLAFSGGLGAAILLLNSPEATKPIAVVVTILTGAVVAVYGVPLFMHYFGIEKAQIGFGVAFFTGIASRSIILQISRLKISDYIGKKKP